MLEKMRENVKLQIKEKAKKANNGIMVKKGLNRGNKGILCGPIGTEIAGHMQRRVACQLAH